MLYFIVFVLINIGLAAIDANKIDKGIRIYHGVNGLVYSVLLTGAYLLSRNWSLVLGLMILRASVFNTSLNYFRGLPLTYISDSTTSIIDQATNFIPKKIGYWSYHITLTLLALILSLV